MRATGFLGTRGEAEYQATLNGAEFDLEAAGIVKIQVVDEGVAIDSNSDDVTLSGSSIKIKWGRLGLPPTTYSPTIYAYRLDDTEGEVIMGPSLEENIALTLVQDERP